MPYFLGNQSSWTVHSRQPSVESPVPPSPSLLHPEGKKMMQTTVAVLKDDPHFFEVTHLKKIPLSERQKFASPRVNLERPFAQVHLRPVSPLGLGAARSTSSLSIASQCDYTRSPQVPTHSSMKGLGIGDASSTRSLAPSLSQRSGLGISPSPSSASVGPTSTLARDYLNHIMSDFHRFAPSRSRQYLSPGPDLSFGGISDDSVSSGALATPLTDGNSSALPLANLEPLRYSPRLSVFENIKKAEEFLEPVAQSVSPCGSQQSLHSSLSSDLGKRTRITRTFNSIPSFKRDQKKAAVEIMQPSSSSSSNSLRQTRARTLCEGISGDKGRLHRRKRHAMYGDGGMQMAFSALDEDRSFTDVFKPREPQPLSLSSPKSQLPKYSRRTNFRDHNSMPVVSKRRATTGMVQEHGFPPDIIDLLEEIDIQIAEWQAIA